MNWSTPVKQTLDCYELLFRHDVATGSTNIMRLIACGGRYRVDSYLNNLYSHLVSALWTVHLVVPPVVSGKYLSIMELKPITIHF